jgi:hypothetical protein
VDGVPRDAIHRPAARARRYLPRVDAGQIQAALDDVIDQAVVFHAFTDYLRDYEIIVYSQADPRTGIRPRYDRFLFRYCVEASIVPRVRAEVWARSLDERLIDYETAREADGYLWGSKWQIISPGGTVVADSDRARKWADAVGIDFSEVRLELNAHDLSLVFSDLAITEVAPGYAPFVVGREHHVISPTPLLPDDPD